MTSLEDFLVFKERHPESFSPRVEDTIKQHALIRGIRTDFLGHVPAQEIAVIGEELREHLQARGTNSRQRAVLDEMLEFIRESGSNDRDVKIYGLEAITPVALLMRGRFPKFVGTEFCRDDHERKQLFPILHGDICQSSFPTSAFDMVVSNDVLEHVPDIDAALRETVRILRPGGRMIATFPFFCERAVGQRFASLIDGKEAFHVLPPMYHGNPVDGASSSLVYEIPAWDIIERACAAGFARPRMRLLCDQNKGIAASNPKGVFVAIFDR
jgi:SAM-dependent methyltransferase